MIDKIQDEIGTAKTKRHEHVWRKFYLVAIFIALGVFPFGPSTDASRLQLLLYVAPFLAVAHDMYIFGEDYRIRRASAFIRKAAGETANSEGSHIRWENFMNDIHWEHFKLNYPSLSNEIGCIAVTIIFLAASCFGLWYDADGKNLSWLISSVVLFEAVVFLFYLSRRRRLVKSEDDS